MLFPLSSFLLSAWIWNHFVFPFYCVLVELKELLLNGAEITAALAF